MKTCQNVKRVYLISKNMFEDVLITPQGSNWNIERSAVVSFIFVSRKNKKGTRKNC